MEIRMKVDDLLEQAKAAQGVYLAAYNEGYKKGWDDACAVALEILNKPKRVYTKPEKNHANQ
jgi:hypothetical protein